MITIENDEKEYERWYHSNPAGYILNVPKKITKNSPIYLHKIPCSHVAPYPGWNYTDGAKKKVCSLNRQELIDLAVKTSENFKLCPDCNP
jgi:hypothetical protein